MNKQELAHKLAEATGLSSEEAIRAVDSVFETIADALKKGDDVRLRGFGTFSTRRLRTGRNPRTGEIVSVGGKRPQFRPVKSLVEGLGSEDEDDDGHGGARINYEPS